ncbi:hypothetical protein AV545_03695 [Paenibacillus jamilae]|uniref:hypothetical protein n=1 Tax=Paenibacillus jamilae TaxID=114136 RepID=UPI0007ABC6B7|nr:hypothetical protein [Paenibacillus jamilae]KZE65035.1 hypothetical protein AV545_03695 [Paenibacillus jamilae]
MVNQTIKKVFESIKKKKNLQSKTTRIFKLNHAADENETDYWVSAPYTLEVFEAICAHIQFECEKIEMSYGMSQDEVIEILEKFYECEKIERPKSGSYFNVDLNYSREMFCGSNTNLEEIKTIQREGMEEYFKKYILEFYDMHPNWRPKETVK